MKKMTPISLDNARGLVDFGGKSQAAQSFAESQLEGAVAVYNTLSRSGFSYLADEVGMGKTYVALGAIGLMRHIQRGLRVLYVVPRENMQIKWRKEISNFAANNWRVEDHLVKTFQGTSAPQLSVCGNLLDLVKNAAIHADQDFLLRMSSFSFSLRENKEGWKKYRDQLLHYMPWLPKESFDLRSKDGFKDAFARAVNAILPRFDLVVIDEGHNLKHGFSESVSARNRILALVLGHEDAIAPWYEGCGKRADRVLVLSATPVETDFLELWNQMDVVGKGHLAKELADKERPDADKKEIAGRFLIRRVTGLKIDDVLHTKNMYRREWRNGGVSSHDEPLQTPGIRQRLIVALIQSKVAEILQQMGKKQGKHFRRSFQIGMLSSFESFLQTAKVHTETEEAGNFDDVDQTNNLTEREGVDTPTIDDIARSYRRRFKEPMPHPKMDAVSKRLWTDFRGGEKSLVFVRRVASVTELQAKVEKEYDDWLHRYLQEALVAAPNVAIEFEECFLHYMEERDRQKRKKDPGVVTMAEPEMEDSDEERNGVGEEYDPGDNNTFFSWFFRGDGPPEILSGAAFRVNRLNSEGSTLSTFFEDNYLTYLQRRTEVPEDGLASLCGLSVEQFSENVRKIAFGAFRRDSKQQKFSKGRVYLAYQEAALRMVSVTRTKIGNMARTVVSELFPDTIPQDITPQNFPGHEEYLGARTFFTELESRADLCRELWPESGKADFRETFREREMRRELLRAAIVLGHPMIDLWTLAVLRIGSIRLREQDRSEEQVELLARDFLTLLERQKAEGGLSSWKELAHIGARFDLIMDVNFPEVRAMAPVKLRRYYQATLGHQQPVGGMSGGVNNRLVKQFRMPGYPYILVTTDVLQEGEDLHTFCSRIYHYGITWTPSAMEQRIGRVDRIGSLTHRRLDGARSPSSEEYLQVFFPYLADTVEIVQVQLVFRRINRFLEMVHEAIPLIRSESSKIDLNSQMLNVPRYVEPIRTPLKSSFEIRPGLLEGDPSVVPHLNLKTGEMRIRWFQHLADWLGKDPAVEWKEDRKPFEKCGTLYLAKGDTIREGEISNMEGARRQAFRLSLCSASGGGQVLLQCSSTIGTVSWEDEEKFGQVLDEHRRIGCAKISAVYDERKKCHYLQAVTTILFDQDHTQPDEVLAAVRDAVICADEIERVVFKVDVSQEEFLEYPAEESVYE